MKPEKNQLVEQSPVQANPYLCDPNDWEIVRDDDEVFHAQRSDELQKEADAECNRNPGKRSVATEPGDANKPRTPAGRDEQ
jgi:hypothetical protein